MSYRKPRLDAQDAFLKNELVKGLLFSKRPKRTDRTAIGAVLTTLISDCIMRCGLEEQIRFGEHQPVDFVWEYLSFGFECKRFVDTKYVVKAWLKKEVIDRFAEQEKTIGKPIHHRALIVNERRWEKHLDVWLAAKGIHVLEVGKIDSRLGMFEASQVFMAWLEDIVWQICNGQIECAPGINQFRKNAGLEV